MNVMQQTQPARTGTAEPGYLSGFGNGFETEALPGALPIGRNSPQKCAYGLYAEQLSGSPFTAPRGTNERSWLYRIRPSVQHSGKFRKTTLPFWKTAPCTDQHERSIGQLRWSPVPIPKESLTFLTGMRTMTTAGDVNTQAGMAAHIYLVTQSMQGVRVRLTNPARTVVDCFRYRRKVGLDVAMEALRDAVRSRKATVSEINRAAEVRRISSVIGPYLEALSA